MKVIFKRRINNAALTIFLPTILILTIVYATNFFKDFFFEAVVTVNLTALLVLTTLFISVSQSLPPTAYVKLIDVWLLFTQLIPFIEVLLHTWMDSHRVSEDREINHHGKPLSVGGDDDTVSEVKLKKCSKEKGFIMQTLTIQVQPQPEVQDSELVSRNEKLLVNARRNFYEKTKKFEDERHAKCLKFGQKIGKFAVRWRLNKYYYSSGQKILPLFVLVFSVIYWSYGLANYYGYYEPDSS